MLIQDSYNQSDSAHNSHKQKGMDMNTDVWFLNSPAVSRKKKLIRIRIANLLECGKKRS